MRRTYVPALDSASLPPVCSASALVLMMCRIGFELRFAIAASSSSLTSAVCVSTTTTASWPICTVVFPPGADDHEHIALHRQNLELGCAQRRRDEHRAPRRQLRQRHATGELTATHLRSGAAAPARSPGTSLPRRRARPRTATRGAARYSSRNAFVAGQVMRHRAARSLDLDGRDARERTQLQTRVENPIRGTDERLREIDGVHDDGDERQVILVANEVLRRASPCRCAANRCAAPSLPSGASSSP